MPRTRERLAAVLGFPPAELFPEIDEAARARPE